MFLWVSYKEKSWGFFFASLKSMKRGVGSASKCHGSPTQKLSKCSRIRAKIVTDSKDFNSLKERFL
jgi:hypothetical protein